jgi:hypothetical protein
MDSAQSGQMLWSLRRPPKIRAVSVRLAESLKIVALCFILRLVAQLTLCFTHSLEAFLSSLFMSSVSNFSGYPKLASFMVKEGYAIYRQFQELACQDLLYRQSELVHLERELQIIAKHDREAGRDTEEKHYSLDWRKLSTSATRNSPSKQWMKALEVREKLQEYCEFYLCQSALLF